MDSVWSFVFIVFLSFLCWGLDWEFDLNFILVVGFLTNDLLYDLSGLSGNRDFNFVVEDKNIYVCF